MIDIPSLDHSFIQSTMIVSSTIALALTLFGASVTEAAPIGTRTLDVRAMRRLETSQMLAARSMHHSATSYVPGGGNDKRAVDMAAPNVVRGPDEGWRRERAVPRYIRDANARKRSLLPSVGTEPSKKENIPTENVRKSEIPDADLARKAAEPPIESRAVPDDGGQERRSEPVEGRSRPPSPSPNSKSGGSIGSSLEQNQQRDESSDSRLTHPIGHAIPHTRDLKPVSGGPDERRADVDSPPAGPLAPISSLRKAFGI